MLRAWDWEVTWRVIAGQSPVQTQLHVCLRRDRFQTLTSVLWARFHHDLGRTETALVTHPEERATALKPAGFKVIFKQTE